MRDALLHPSAADGASRRLGTVQPEAQNDEDLLHLRIEARLQRCGAEIRLVIAPDADGGRPARHDARLIKAVARGQVWYERLTCGDVNSLRAIAEALQVDERYVSRVLRAALLAPDIVEAILDGRQSPQLSVDKLRFGAPLLWAELRKSFGFGSTSLRPPAPTHS